MKQALIASVTLAALVALPAASRAQAKTNFSGTWAFDAAKSDPAPAGGRRGGGGRGGGGVPAPAALTITQTANQITVDRTMGQGMTSAVYKIDGGESTNAMGDVFLSRSKVSWDGAKLVIATSKDMGMGPNGPLVEDLKEVFSLEGGVLTVVASAHNPPASDQTRKLVYNKKM